MTECQTLILDKLEFHKGLSKLSAFKSQASRNSSATSTFVPQTFQHPQQPAPPASEYTLTIPETQMPSSQNIQPAQQSQVASKGEQQHSRGQLTSFLVVDDQQQAGPSRPLTFILRPTKHSRHKNGHMTNMYLTDSDEEAIVDFMKDHEELYNKINKHFKGKAREERGSPTVASCLSKCERFSARSRSTKDMLWQAHII